MGDTPLTTLQFLRTIDKMDRIGLDGVCDLLAKPAEEYGAGLADYQVQMVRFFFAPSSRSDDSGTVSLDEMRSRLKHLYKVKSRLVMIALLEEGGEDGRETALDRLLAMRVSDDQSWSNGQRPANIAWAIDDLVQLFAIKAECNARAIPSRQPERN